METAETPRPAKTIPSTFQVLPSASPTLVAQPPTQPATQPAIQLTQSADGPPPQITPSPAPFLSLPIHTQLAPPPLGWPDSPLLGVTALAIHPDYPTTPLLAAGTNIGLLLISLNGGVAWTWSGDGLPADSAIGHVTLFHEEMIALTEYGGAYRSRDNGGHWRPISSLSAGVEQVIFSTAYAEDGILFAVQNGALLRSTDWGDSWTVVLPPNGCPLNIALSPTFAADSTAFAPRCDHLARSTDAGATWSDVPLEGENLNVGLLMNIQIAQDRLLAQGNTQGMPLFSTDGGQSWERAYDPDQAPFLLGSLWNAIQVSPDGSYHVAGRASLYDSEQTVWRSRDNGQNWYEIARATRLAGLAISASGEVWLGTSDGIFHNAGFGWLLSHPGGGRQELASTPSRGVAVARQGVSKYSSRLRLFEKTDTHWRLAAELLTAETPRGAFPSPDYPDEPLVLLLGQDYGGSVWVMALRPQSDSPLVAIETIPAGSGDSVERYQVTFADDYTASGRIIVRHGQSGALYVSSDRGYTWARPDPAEPGACERNPVSGFGTLWFANDDIRGRLLCPLEDEQPFKGIVQSFERGELLRLDSIAPSTDRLILALIPNWEGNAAWATMPYYETAVPMPEPPDGFFLPDPLFHTAWGEGVCCRPNPVPAVECLGWGAGVASGLDIAMQRFEGGSLIWRSDRDEILVLEQTGAGDVYSVYPD